MNTGSIGKYASVITRLGHIFYDRQLNQYGLGCGQQFFLMRIKETQGISQLELSKKGAFDKGTTAKAVKKLEELGLISRTVNDEDKRANRLYTTERAKEAIDITDKAVIRWNEILTKGFSDEDCVKAIDLLEKMSQNAMEYIREMKIKTEIKEE